MYIYVCILDYWRRVKFSWRGDPTIETGEIYRLQWLVAQTSCLRRLQSCQYNTLVWTHLITLDSLVHSQIDNQNCLVSIRFSNIFQLSYASNVLSVTRVLRQIVWENDGVILTTARRNSKLFFNLRETPSPHTLCLSPPPPHSFLEHLSCGSIEKR